MPPSGSDMGSKASPSDRESVLQMQAVCAPYQLMGHHAQLACLAHVAWAQRCRWTCLWLHLEMTEADRPGGLRMRA